VLVMWEDGCVMSQHPAHDVEASMSQVPLSTPNVVVMLLEQGLRHADAPPTHFNEAQAEQALW
jgi:hypothetical protein